MTQDPFDDIIRQKADGHQSAVPPDAWDNITKNKKRRPLIWWWVVIAIIATTTVYYIVRPANTVNNIPQQSGTINKDSVSRITLQQQSLPTNNTRINSISVNNTNGQKAPATNKPASITGASQAGTQVQNRLTGHSYTQHFHVKQQLKTRIHSGQSGSDDGATGNSIATNEIAVNATNNKTDSIHPSTDSLLAKTDSTKPKKKAVVPTQQTALKKIKGPVKTNGWDLELSATGILPVQQQSAITNTQRITLNPNGSTDAYSVDHQTSSIQPAVALNIAVVKKITDKYKFGIGFQYLQLNEDIRLSGTDSIITKTPIQRLVTDGSGTHLVNDTASVSTVIGNRTINAHNSYRFYSIPLFMQYTLHDAGSWSLLLDGGVYFNIAGSYNNTIEGKWSTADSGKVNTNFSVDIFAGLRFSKTVFTKWDLFAEPALRYALSSQTSFIPKKIDQVGLSFGICYKIN